MGKQGPQRCPHTISQDEDLSFWKKDCQIRCLDTLSSSDPFIGRRISGGDHKWNSKAVLLQGLKNDHGKFSSYKGVHVEKRHTWLQKNLRAIAVMLSVICFIFLLDSLMMSMFDLVNLQSNSSLNSSIWAKDGVSYISSKEKLPVQMYGRLLSLASNSLAENELKHKKSSFWEEPYSNTSLWKPCADRKTRSVGKPDKSNGYIMVSANGGLNQQRVAVCNAVAVASLLNATLVLPRFLYSNVWKDPSQFGDIYQEEYFVNYLKDDVDIVKELPAHLKSLDIEAIGSQLTDADLVKEAKPIDYIRNVLSLLKRNGVLHFLGFGNRLGFDPLPNNIQTLRCKCNFHALKFVPNIQQVASLLMKRIRKYDYSQSKLDKQLVGNFLSNSSSNTHDAPERKSRYLALHLRFEVDMVAYSQCDFGGGENEREELQAYRERHFPLLLERLKNAKPVAPSELRKLGRCPLTPEEAALVLAGLGFKRRTYIYLAGSHIYGGKSRMDPLTNLYPNLVTKETLLATSELAPFANFSSKTQGANCHPWYPDSEHILVVAMPLPYGQTRGG
ncbi:uncharacterized protein At1g04910 isoform X2 [Carica papaya]|uniref:uncharacterized protein At1g04910 isoform X2 n=1 Tax=Carica papaya TaxID=3649 RepID=UPI000B8C8C72|nr:uncharacterized protein At1g04910 isoform X2 [Carica papaya]